MQKVKTHRDKKYLVWLRTQPCVICCNPETEAHHTSSGGMGLKGDYRLAISICHICHSKLHQHTGKGGYWTPDQLRLITTTLYAKYKEKRT